MGPYGLSLIGGVSEVEVLAEIGIVIFAIILAKWIVPRILYYVVRTQSRELLILSIITICFSVAWISHSVGLSLALGAFLAGLVVYESGYSHHTLDNVLPLRDVFTSFFFISIRMLSNYRNGQQIS